MKITKKKTTDFFVIIIIFALAGLTTVYVSSLITDFFGLDKWSLPYILVYVFLIFPTYHFLLLGYAFLFGRFDFFWGRIKKIKSKVVSWIN
ncbi:MAG TPA: DUF6787 family protein [Ignavibacteriaceae bacterium]